MKLADLLACAVVASSGVVAAFFAWGQFGPGAAFGSVVAYAFAAVGVTVLGIVQLNHEDN